MMISLLLALSLQGEQPAAFLDALERKAGSVQTCLAEFDISGVPGVTVIKLSFDRPRQRLLCTIVDGSSSTEQYFMESGKRYRWRNGEPSSITNYAPYLASLEKGFSEVLTKVSVGKEGMWGFAAGLNLEGKPSKDEAGSLDFYCCFSSSPYRWLGRLREEKGLQVVKEERALVFKIPERRKTVKVDPDTGFLRSIETVDYDGTVRSMVCRSVALDAPLPPFPTPPKGRERPLTLDELEQLLGGRRQVFKDLVKEVVRRWDQVAKSGRAPEIGQAFKREFETTASMWYEVRLHQAAAYWIRQKLNGGTSWQTLKANADVEGEQFLKAMSDNREEDRAYLAKHLEQFMGSLEDLFQENARKGLDPSEYREMLRSAVDFNSMFNEHLKSFDKRPEGIFKEELENAREV